MQRKYAVALIALVALAGLAYTTTVVAVFRRTADGPPVMARG